MSYTAWCSQPGIQDYSRKTFHLSKTVLKIFFQVCVQLWFWFYYLSLWFSSVQSTNITVQKSAGYRQVSAFFSILPTEYAMSTEFLLNFVLEASLNTHCTLPLLIGYEQRWAKSDLNTDLPVVLTNLFMKLRTNAIPLSLLTEGFWSNTIY